MRIYQAEKKRQIQQTKLDLRKNFSDRNRLGQYSTPPELALEIAKLAKEHLFGEFRKIKFLDPGFGTGVFFSAIKHIFPNDSIETATGIEIDQHHALTARKIWEPFGVDIIEDDFASLSPTQSDLANLIICNPPYVRHHHLTSKQKIHLQKKVFEELQLKPSGLSGLHSYFILLSHQWMMPNGIGIWLIPAEFMAVNYGDIIRQYLTHKVTLLHIHKFDSEDVQFSDALVSSAVVVIKNSVPTDTHEVKITIGGGLNNPRKSIFVGNSFLKSQTKWNSFNQKETGTNSTENPEIFLADFFKTRRGIATGGNSFFILSRTRANELGLPKKFLLPILPSPRFLSNNIVNADTDGFPLLENQLVLLSCDIAEDEIEDKYPALWQYLLYGKKQGIHKRYLSRKRSPWYKQEVVKPAPFLVTYMGRKSKHLVPFRFIWNKSQAVAPNTYLLIYPLPHIETHTKEIKQQLKVYKLFQQIKIDLLIQEGRTYGGGLYKIEPNELRNIRLDDIELARELFSSTKLI